MENWQPLHVCLLIFISKSDIKPIYFQCKSFSRKHFLVAQRHFRCIIYNSETRCAASLWAMVSRFLLGRLSLSWEPSYCREESGECRLQVPGRVSCRIWQTTKSTEARCRISDRHHLVKVPGKSSESVTCGQLAVVTDLEAGLLQRSSFRRTH